MIEHWIEIEEAPRYAVSNLGRVQNIKTGRILKQQKDRKGYLHVGLVVGGQPYQIDRRVNRLVCMAFHNEGHEGLEVRYIDGDKSNNFIGNLEWSTHADNMELASMNGLLNMERGRKPIRVRIIETGEIFESLAECARAIGGYSGTISECLKGYRNSHCGFKFEEVDNMET